MAEVWMVAVDFSDCSLAAAKRAAELASSRSGQLLLVNALPTVPVEQKFASDAANAADKDRIEQRLKQLANNLLEEQPGLDIDTDVVGSSPVEAIIAAAEERGASFLVVGTHGRTGISHLVLGSVAEQIARRAPCPVLIVKAEA